MIKNTRDIILSKYPNCNVHYLNRYLKLVDSKFNLKDKVFEKHHILPKSIWPEYEYLKDNCIKLPLKAHFLAHNILVKMLPDDEKMKYALYFMSKSKKHDSSIKTCRIFEECRLSFLNSIKDSHRKRMQNNTHHLSGENSNNLKRIKMGIHHWQNVKPWNSCNCTNSSLYVWSQADIILEYHLKNPTDGSKKIHKKLRLENKPKYSPTVVTNILKRFKNGWIPDKDSDWLKFKENFTNEQSNTNNKQS